MNSSIIFANWLFLIGSTIFSINAAIEISESQSLHSVFSVLASLAFTVACLLFMKDAYKQNRG